MSAEEFAALRARIELIEALVARGHGVPRERRRVVLKSKEEEEDDDERTMGGAGGGAVVARDATKEDEEEQQEARLESAVGSSLKSMLDIFGTSVRESVYGHTVGSSVQTTVAFWNSVLNFESGRDECRVRTMNRELRRVARSVALQNALHRPNRRLWKRNRDTSVKNGKRESILSLGGRSPRRSRWRSSLRSRGALTWRFGSPARSCSSSARSSPVSRSPAPSI